MCLIFRRSFSSSSPSSELYGLESTAGVHNIIKNNFQSFSSISLLRDSSTSLTLVFATAASVSSSRTISHSVFSSSCTRKKKRLEIRVRNVFLSWLSPSCTIEHIAERGPLTPVRNGQKGEQQRDHHTLCTETLFKSSLFSVRLISKIIYTTTIIITRRKQRTV